MRVRLPFLKGLPSASEQIKELISPIPGIKQVEFNPITGSALISYDAEHYESFPAQLAEFVENNLGLTLTSEPALGANHKAGSSDDQSEVTHFLVDSFKRLDAEVSKASENGVDMKALLPLSLAAYALFKMGTAVATPLWVTLGLFSFTSFVALHPGALNESVNKEQRNRRQPKGMSHRRPTRSS